MNAIILKDFILINWVNFIFDMQVGQLKWSERRLLQNWIKQLLQALNEHLGHSNGSSNISEFSIKI